MTAAIVIGLVAFGVSLLTLFSGFGLGTLLLPAFAVFFPIEVAVASTAIVHAANNLFKAGQTTLYKAGLAGGKQDITQRDNYTAFGLS